MDKTKVITNFSQTTETTRISYSLRLGRTLYSMTGILRMPFLSKNVYCIYQNVLNIVVLYSYLVTLWESTLKAAAAALAAA